MRRLCFITALSLTLACGVRADLHPEQLRSFEMKPSPLLRGFVVSKSGPNELGQSEENPPGASAFINRRFFGGSNEIRYTVILFPSKDAVKKWDMMAGRANPAWASITAKDGTVRAYSVTYINKVAIALLAVPHPEAKRRDPRAYKAALPVEAFQKLAGKIRAELIRRAKGLKDNQGYR
jgi:hypothetical protein